METLENRDARASTWVFYCVMVVLSREEALSDGSDGLGCVLTIRGGARMRKPLVADVFEGGEDFVGADKAHASVSACVEVANRMARGAARFTLVMYDEGAVAFRRP